jgi:hypothetical protein
MSISQQLVRKLLKAHTTTTSSLSLSSNENSEIVTAAAAKKASNLKRQRDDSTVAALHRGNHNHNNNHLDHRVTNEDIIQYKAKILNITNREMAVSIRNKKKKKSNIAYQKLIRQRERTLQEQQEQQQQNAVQNIVVSTGSARSSTDHLVKSSLVKIPTYNKVRYEQERKERKRMKLAQALEKLQKKGDQKTPVRKKTIFG